MILILKLMVDNQEDDKTKDEELAKKTHNVLNNIEETPATTTPATGTGPTMASQQ